MATDYFLGREQQESVSSAIQKVVKPIQDGIDADVQERLDYAVAQWTGIAVAIMFIALAWIGVHALQFFASGGEPWVVGLASLFFLLLFAGGMPKITAAIVEIAVPLALATSMRLVTTFLIRCPKGTVFGIGFILLMIAFTCRYLNLK